MSKEKKEKNPNKLGAGTFLLWCGNGTSMAVQSVVLGLLTIYCTNALGMDAMLVGTILMFSKLIDSVTDLCAGYLVDRTNTKIGRGRPYDLCILGLWLFTWLLFTVPASLSTPVKCAWIFICYALCQSVFRTFLTAAGTPYMVRAFNNEQKYVKISSLGGLLTTCVIMVFNVITPMLYANIISDAAGWSRLIGFFAIPMTIIGMLRFFFIPEKYVVEDTKEQRATFKEVLSLLKGNKYIYIIAILQIAVGMAGSLGVAGYYFLYIVGNVAISGVISLFSIVAMLSLIFYPMLLKKISTKQLIEFSLLVSIPYGIIGFIAKDNLTLLAIQGVLMGFVTLPASYMSGLLIIDCADYNEYKGHPRMEGSFGSISGFAYKVGGALATFVSGGLLSLCGFNGAASEQPASAIMAIRACNSLVPMLFFLTAAAAMHFYDLDKKKPEIAEELAKKREALQEREEM